MAHPVLIVEDHQATALGLMSLIRSSPRFEVAGAAATGSEALVKAAETKPELLCLDLGLPGELDGFDVCRQLCARDPDLKVVVYTGHEELGVVARARESGALGVVAKSEAYRELLRALMLALDGQAYTSPLYAQAALAPVLSPRQREVLALMAEGLDNRAIADRLSLSSAETVKTHVKNILDRLDASHRTQAVAIGLRYMLID